METVFYAAESATDVPPADGFVALGVFGLCFYMAFVVLLAPVLDPEDRS